VPSLSKVKEAASTPQGSKAEPPAVVNSASVVKVGFGVVPQTIAAAGGQLIDGAVLS
jgi:hypothetical protein